MLHDPRVRRQLRVGQPGDLHRRERVPQLLADLLAGDRVVECVHSRSLDAVRVQARQHAEELPERR